MTLGADPVAYAIANYATRTGNVLDAFTVRKEAKGHGTGRQIEGGLAPGARVVVVEDSVTTGGSLLRALDVVAAHGAIVLGVLALVDRQEGGAESLGGRRVRLSRGIRRQRTPLEAGRGALHGLRERCGPRPAM